MNKFVVSFVFSAFAMSAFAQSPTPMPTAPTPAPAAAPEQDQTAVTNISADGGKTVDRKCLRETGSHIPRKDKRDCMNANGNSYSREDIDHTGAVDVADALRLLDPSVGR